MNRPFTALRRAATGVRWYVRELTGEARWDDYLARCAREGESPLDRRTWERHRADAREHTRQARCC